MNFKKKGLKKKKQPGPWAEAIPVLCTQWRDLMQNQQKIKDPVTEEKCQETVRQNWDEKGRKTDIQIIKKSALAFYHMD